MKPIARLFSMAFCLFTLPFPGHSEVDKDSWKLPLAEKERILEQMLQDRHWLGGIYASEVTLDEHGRADLTTTGHADVTHSVNWTSYYLCGQILKHEITGDPKDYAHVLEAVEGLLRLNAINGVPGLWSRGYIYGHGPTYEERKHEGANNLWHQGVPPYENLRYRGHPSHHTYSGVSRALRMAYDFIEDATLRARIRQAFSEMIHYAYLANDYKVMDRDGNQSADLLAWPPYDAPCTHNLFVTSALKYAADITGEPEIVQAYKGLIAKFRYREFADRPVEDLREMIELGGTDHDDAEHAYGHLYNLVRIETDPVLLKLYRKFAEALWTWHRDEGQAYYNFGFFSISCGSISLSTGESCP